MRDSFILYTKYRKQFSDLTNEQKGILFDAILAYVSEEPLPEMDAITSMAFKFVKVDIDDNAAKYEEKCQQNRRNVSKRWHTDEYDRIRPNTNATDMKCNDNDMNIKRESKPKRKGRTNSFNNFPERVYDYSDLEAKLKAVDSNREDLEGYAN